MNNLEELKRKALAATPGPWEAHEEFAKSFSDHGYRKVVASHRASQLNVYALAENMLKENKGYVWGEDSEFISAANPSAVLELIERIERLEAELNALRDTNHKIAERLVKKNDDYRELGFQRDKLVVERDALKLEREQWMKQEPVAWFDRDYGSCIRWKDGLVRSDFVDGQSLYTSPASAFKVAAEWLRNNYHAYANIDSICDAMIKSGYSMDCVKPIPEKTVKAEPVFYYRPTSSGGYEGPILAESIDAVRINSGVWKPLYAHPVPAQQELEVTDNSKTLANALARIEELEAEPLPEGVADLIRFMCKTWASIDKFVYEHCGNALMHYPVIQGTRNQFDLGKIGQQPFDKDKIRAGVEFMLGGVPAQQFSSENYAFKNFHRMLCERFNYPHDPVDWARDQVSLIEHIAAILEEQPSPAVAVPDLNLIGDALSHAMVICDNVPTHVHLPQSCAPVEFQEIGKLVNVQDNGFHGYALIRDAKYHVDSLLSVNPTPPSAEHIPDAGEMVPYRAAPTVKESLTVEKKPKRITEQDAREILASYSAYAGADAEIFINAWLNTHEGRNLLTKLNENREPDYKAQRDELLAVIAKHEGEK